MTRTRMLAIILATAALAGCAGQSANDIQLGQERQACAEVGIDPGSSAFSSCVADLDATLFQLKMNNG